MGGMGLKPILQHHGDDMSHIALDAVPFCPRMRHVCQRFVQLLIRNGHSLPIRHTLSIVHTKYFGNGTNV